MRLCSVYVTGYRISSDGKTSCSTNQSIWRRNYSYFIHIFMLWFYILFYLHFIILHCHFYYLTMFMKVRPWLSKSRPNVSSSVWQKDRTYILIHMKLYSVYTVVDKNIRFNFSLYLSQICVNNQHDPNVAPVANYFLVTIDSMCVWPFKVGQGHRLLHKSKAHDMLLWN